MLKVITYFFIIIDMIVIGSGGPDPELGVFLGSVANHITNKSKIPVTVVKWNNRLEHNFVIKQIFIFWYNRESFSSYY